MVNGAIDDFIFCSKVSCGGATDADCLATCQTVISNYFDDIGGITAEIEPENAVQDQSEAVQGASDASGAEEEETSV